MCCEKGPKINCMVKFGMDMVCVCVCVSPIDSRSKQLAPFSIS